MVFCVDGYKRFIGGGDRFVVLYRVKKKKVNVGRVLLVIVNFSYFMIFLKKFVLEIYLNKLFVMVKRNKIIKNM